MFRTPFSQQDAARCSKCDQIAKSCNTPATYHNLYTSVPSKSTMFFVLPSLSKVGHGGTSPLHAISTAQAAPLLLILSHHELLLQQDLHFLYFNQRSVQSRMVLLLLVQFCLLCNQLCFQMGVFLLTCSQLCFQQLSCLVPGFSFVLGQRRRFLPALLVWSLVAFRTLSVLFIQFSKGLAPCFPIKTLHLVIILRFRTTKLLLQCVSNISHREVKSCCVLPLAKSHIFSYIVNW